MFLVSEQLLGIGELEGVAIYKILGDVFRYFVHSYLGTSTLPKTIIEPMKIDSWKIKFPFWDGLFSDAILVLRAGAHRASCSIGDELISISKPCI